MEDRDESETAASRWEGVREERQASDAAALADDLGRVHLETIDDRRLRARVDSIVDHDESTVRVWYELPHGVRVSEDFEKPIPWSDRFAFARLVADLGYSASSVDCIEGESLTLERTIDDRWRAEVPPRHRPDPHEVAQAMGETSALTIVGLGTTLLYLVLLFVVALGNASLTAAIGTVLLLCIAMVLLVRVR